LFQGWLNDSGLPDAIQEQLVRLSYSRGTSMCFSDLQVFGGADGSTKQQILRTLARVPALTATLKIDERSDIGSLASYWGAGGREPEVRAMLEASAHAEGGARIPLTSLLPRFARIRLYTYPVAKRGPERPGPDCFWSALNFFNDDADEASFDKHSITERLENEYVAAAGPLQLGDLILLKDYRGMLLHACVFIADGMVFTKNGASYHQPWTLQELDDMVDGYLITQEPGQTIPFEVYHHKTT
jgi:hypothetical protein